MSDLELVLALFCAALIFFVSGLVYRHRRFRIYMEARLDAVMAKYRALKEDIDRGRWGR